MNTISRYCFFVVVVFFAIWLAGCEESNLSGTTDGQTRLVASKNIELKKELEAQKKLLADCQKNNARLEKQLEQKTGEENLKMMQALEEMLSEKKGDK